MAGVGTHRGGPGGPGARRFRILLVGVGGQGVLTAARLLGDAASDLQIPTMVGQLHGMSQRGGSVEAFVLMGPGESAFLGDGEADVVLGFEPLETLRAIGRMSDRTHVVVSTGRIPPFALAQRGGEYPATEDIVGRLTARCAAVHVVDGPALALEAGDVRVMNVVLLGVLTALCDLPVAAETVGQAIVARFPARYREPNRRAFEVGREVRPVGVEGGRSGRS